MNATLVYSAKPGRNPFIKVYSPEKENSIDKFMDALFTNASRAQARRRLVIGRNFYSYTPSNEWKQINVRFKGIK
jgi:hypothetical protein